MDDRIVSPASSSRTRERTGLAKAGPPPIIAPVITPMASSRGISHEPSPTAGLRMRLHNSRLPLLLLAAGTFLLHFAAAALTPYGPHRDELLYLAMGRHLRFWAMDFPPGIAVVAEAVRMLVGPSIAVVRMTSALAATALVVLTFVLARAFGGSRRASVLAAVAILVSPLFLRAGFLFQPVVFDQLWWTVALAALVRIGNVRTALLRNGRAAMRARGWESESRPPDASAWVTLGFAMGLGLLTKFSIVFVGAGVVVALLATPLRRTLRTRWPWIALAIALVIGSPSLVGQFRLGWPVIGQMAELRATQLERVGPVEFVLGQLSVGPAFVLAALGMWHLLRDPNTRAWRAIGWACATAFVILLVTHGKSYYAAPIYPTLTAAGAVLLDRRIMRLPTLARRRSMHAVAFGVVALFGLLMLPFGLPILPPAPMVRYAALFGSTGTTTNTGTRLALPQDYADMLGWPEQAFTVASVLETLPEAERREAVILARNYGEAGAIDFYGPLLGLPAVVSPAGSYWFFGPGDLPGNVVIAIGVTPAELAPFCKRVTPVTRVRPEHPEWMVEEERDVPITLCHDTHESLQELWPTLRPGTPRGTSE